jgi:hypothetical protein
MQHKHCMTLSPVPVPWHRVGSRHLAMSKPSVEFSICFSVGAKQSIVTLTGNRPRP